MNTSHPMQRTFAELSRSRASDPATSRAAAAQSIGLAGEHCGLILQALADSAVPLSAHEIAARCGLTPVQVSRRLGGLRDDGLVEVGERVAETPSGRMAQTWRRS